jgi:phage shock protein PspC (stress-responsive transcriptional regulator)
MQRLVRYPEKGYVAGVCHGMGIHTGLDPILWRAIALCSGGGFLVYLVLWVFLKKGHDQ